MKKVGLKKERKQESVISLWGGKKKERIISLLENLNILEGVPVVAQQIKDMT